MGIQSVNGTNVYVISADVPRATDGRGKSYSTFYTDLRWQIWEQVQVSALQSMQFEQEAYQAALAGIDARLLQNQKDIAALRAGEIEAVDALHKDRLNYSMQMEKSKASQFTTKSGGTSTRTSQVRGRGGSGDGSGYGIDAYLQDAIHGAESEVAAQAGGPGAPADSEAQSNATVSALINRGNAIMEGGVTLTIEGEDGPGVIDPSEHQAFQAAMVEHEVNKRQRAVLDDPNIPADAVPGALLAAKADALETFASNNGGSYVAAYEALGSPSGSGGTFQSGSSKSWSVREPTYTPDTEAPEGGIGDRGPELERLLNEQAMLEAQRAGIQAPETDLLQRTREDFAARIGPGNFGTDPRKDRRQELFDEKEALAQADDIMAARQGLTDMEIFYQDQYDTAKVAHDRLGGEEYFAAMQDAERNLEEIRKVREKLTSSPVAQGDFLSRDTGGEVLYTRGGGRERPPRPPRTPRTPAEAPVEPQVAPAAPQVPLATTAGPAPVREDLMFLEELGGPLPAQDFGAPPSAAEARQYVRPASSVSPSPSFRDTELDFLGAQALAEEPAAGFRDQRTVASPEGVERTEERLAAGLPAGRSVVERRLPQSAGDALPVSAERFDEPLSPGKRERRANYQARMIIAGIKLAGQKKKFERLSKPNLPEAQRQTAVPEYVRLVEELYETNESAGADPVKATFDELSKVYGDDPRLRQQAHTYLFALDVLKNEKPE
jgi:hypothetical protein